MFVHFIPVSVFLCLCMLYNIIVGYTLSWYFVLYLSYAWVIPPLHYCYICDCINMFVNVISMVNAICLCTSCVLLLGFGASWESCNTYFLYIICYSVVVILIDLHSKNWINISLFELFFTCIETHIFVPSISISHIFISIIKFFCCFSVGFTCSACCLLRCC